jgi:hypothetical protein
LAQINKHGQSPEQSVKLELQLGRSVSVQVAAHGDNLTALADLDRHRELIHQPLNSAKQFTDGHTQIHANPPRRTPGM